MFNCNTWNIINLFNFGLLILWKWLGLFFLPERASDEHTDVLEVSTTCIQIDIFNYFVYATWVRVCCFHIAKTDPNDTTSEDKLNPLLTFVADLG